MAKDFEYEEAGRRPMTWFALGVFLVLCWIAYTNSAPWWIWAIWTISGGMIVYLLIANTKSGMSITDSTLSYWAGGPKHTLALRDIDHVVIEDWTDSTDVSIVLTNGNSIPLSTTCVPPTRQLERQLADRRINYVRK